MRNSRTVTAMAAAALITVVCGGCSNSKSTTTTESPATAATSPGSPAATPTSTGNTSPAAGSTGAGATVAAATVGKYQNVLVDSQGKTLYLFEADTSPTSVCYDACATAWPPLLTTGTPTAGKGVDQAKLSTTARKDGTSQVVYNGHPLYYFVEDKAPGDTTGQGSHDFGAGWYVVDIAGDGVEGG